MKKKKKSTENIFRGFFKIITISFICGVYTQQTGQRFWRGAERLIESWTPKSYVNQMIQKIIRSIRPAGNRP